MVLNRPIGHRVAFHRLFKAVVAGVAGNILTPSTYLGGEPLKVVYVGRTTGLPYHEVAGTVVLCKYLEAISFILFFGFSTLVAAVSFHGVLFRAPWLPAGLTLLALAAALLVLGGVLWVSLSRRRRPLTRLVGLLARGPLFARFFAGLRERTHAMEGQVSRVFCEEGMASLLGFLAFVVAHAAVVAKPAAFFFLGAGNGLGLGEVCLIFVACQGLLAVQITPSGVGTLDGGLIGTFALMGLSEAQCMAFLLCLRFWDVLIVGSGAFLAARVGAKILSGKFAPPKTVDLLEKPQPDEQA
jgi:uncharacterized protein (TIRG00374 family)